MPHTLHDYKIRSLADRIKDLPQLMYLCKSDDTVKPKDDVFRHYYQKIVSNSSREFDLFLVAYIVYIRIP